MGIGWLQKMKQLDIDVSPPAIITSFWLTLTLNPVTFDLEPDASDKNPIGTKGPGESGARFIRKSTILLNV